MAYERLNLIPRVSDWKAEHVVHLEDAIIGLEKELGNKLDETELDSAIETSLNEAKNSGEFNGNDGKSAYQYAKDGGYTGTEEEFAALVGNLPNIVASTTPVTDGSTSSYPEGTLYLVLSSSN